MRPSANAECGAGFTGSRKHQIGREWSANSASLPFTLKGFKGFAYARSLPRPCRRTRRPRDSASAAVDAADRPSLVGLLKNPPEGEEAFLLDLITNRVPAGVDDAAKVKAEYLAKVAKGEEASSLISKVRATELLGTMLGGFNIKPLIDLLACAGMRRRGCASAEEHAVDVRLLQRREGAGRLRQARQRQRQGRHAILGRCRVVHLAPRRAGKPHGHDLQGDRAKPTPTISRPRPTPGPAPTSRCMRWPC